MLFLLDHDVDAAVGRILRSHDHECVTAANVYLDDAGDDALTVWADDHDAVLVSADRAFAQRRGRHSIGWHVWIRCPDWEAANVLAEHLSEIVDVVAGRGNVVIRVSKRDVRVSSGWR